MYVRLPGSILISQHEHGTQVPVACKAEQISTMEQIMENASVTKNYFSNSFFRRPDLSMIEMIILRS